MKDPGYRHGVGLHVLPAEGLSRDGSSMTFTLQADNCECPRDETEALATHTD